MLKILGMRVALLQGSTQFLVTIMQVTESWMEAFNHAGMPLQCILAIRRQGMIPTFFILLSYIPAFPLDSCVRLIRTDIMPFQVEFTLHEDG